MVIVKNSYAPPAGEAGPASFGKHRRHSKPKHVMRHGNCYLKFKSGKLRRVKKHNCK